MPVVIHTQVSVSNGGKAVWMIKQPSLVRIGDVDFAKIAPWDQSFIRLVCEGTDVVKPMNASLSHSPGFQELKRARNTKQSRELEEAETPPASCGLFGRGEAPEPAAKKRSRRSMTQMKELREAPEALTLEAPSIDQREPPKLIRCIRPIHPCDDLAIELTSETVERVIDVIRSRGITTDMLTTKRRYTRRSLEEPPVEAPENCSDAEEESSEKAGGNEEPHKSSSPSDSCSAEGGVRVS